MAERWLVRTWTTRGTGELRELKKQVYESKPGEPCCVLTRSGKHQHDCPRVRAVALDALVEAVRPILAAYRSEPVHITEDQITEAWAALDHARLLSQSPDESTQEMNDG